MKKWLKLQKFEKYYHIKTHWNLDFLGKFDGGRKKLVNFKVFFCLKKFFCSKRVKPWEFWKIPRKLVIFWKFFEKCAKKGQILPTFCENNKVYQEEFKKIFKKSASVSDFEHFCHFQTPFYLGLCQYTKVKPWKIWFSKEVSKFYHFAIFGPHFHQLFAKILRCTKKNLRKKVYIR